MEGDDCPFLRLPTELRLLIYSFALLETSAITIGTAELVGSHPDIVHRLYGEQRNPTQGILTNHEPVIESTYNPTLLSITNPAIIPLPPTLSCPPEQALKVYTAQASLLLVNRQINRELTSHFNRSKSTRTSLFVSFPHGLHVLTTLAPCLARQARSIHVAGMYTPRHFDTARAVCLPLSYRMPPGMDQTYHGNVTPNTTSQLSSLMASVFGPNPKHSSIERLELRIYYPGANSYASVWGDDNSPTCIALRSIYAGEINIEVWRGQRGTGVYITATRPRDAEARNKRVVSTVWRRLEEGRRGEPRCGSWIVDPKWPEWNIGGKSHEADMVVSASV